MLLALPAVVDEVLEPSALGRDVLYAGVSIGGVSILAWAYVYFRIATGDPDLDRFGIRGNVAYAALRTWGPRAVADLRLPRACMAIVWKETGGRPAEYVGDTGAKGGPSIGPMQLYRATAQDFGIWTPPPGASDAEIRSAYETLAQDEHWGIMGGARELAEHLVDHQGDLPSAIKAYNGSGPDADKYRDRVLTWASDEGWDLSGNSSPSVLTSPLLVLPAVAIAGMLVGTYIEHRRAS